MLTLREKVRRIAGLTLITLGAACSTDANAPTGLVPTDASATVFGGGSTKSTNTLKGTREPGGSVGSLAWFGHRNRDYTVSQTIGPEGGVVRIPDTGFELVVPANAVSTPTNFSVTALAGRSVAFEFQPHGTTFKVPLTFRQNIRYTRFGHGQHLKGAYFEDRTKINANTGAATVLEQIDASVNGDWIEFLIHHFSGYLVSCA